MSPIEFGTTFADLYSNRYCSHSGTEGSGVVNNRVNNATLKDISELLLQIKRKEHLRHPTFNRTYCILAWPFHDIKLASDTKFGVTNGQISK